MSLRETPIVAAAAALIALHVLDDNFLQPRLEGRPDVDPDRIGGFGSSAGGEILLGAAAQSTLFRAVVSEGAGF